LTFKKLRLNALNKTKRGENLRMAKLLRDKSSKKTKKMLGMNLRQKKKLGTKLAINHSRQKRSSMSYASIQWVKIGVTQKTKNSRPSELFKASETDGRLLKSKILKMMSARSWSAPNTTRLTRRPTSCWIRQKSRELPKTKLPTDLSQLKEKIHPPTLRST